MTLVRTIFFADIEGSVQLFRRLGDALALAAVEACHEATRAAVTGRGGAVVKLIGDGLMAAFETPAAACEAAVLAQEAVMRTAGEGEPALRLRIGMHAGPVIETGNDLFGDTVNIAARLSAVANGGEIIVSAAMAEGLPDAMRIMLRRLGGISLKGVGDNFPVLELLWAQEAGVTVLPHHIAKQTVSTGAVRLELAYGGKRWRSIGAASRIMIGRNPVCDFVVTDPRASRDHATIQRDGEQWVLLDHSTNGTFVVFAGESVVALRRKDSVLHGIGSIGFGFDPERETAERLQFKVFSSVVS